MEKKILIFIPIALILLAGIGAAIFISIPAPVPTTPFFDSYVGNLHTHTTASDGKMSYQEAIDQALKLGFRFIAITDHNTIGKETKEDCPEETKILCIIGEEISSKEGHILAIDIKATIPANLSAKETIEKIHQQGGLAIPAHPNSSNGLTSAQIKKLPFDAVECNFRHKKSGENKFSCDSLLDFPKVYNSDAHKKEELGLGATECKLIYKGIQSLKEAIKEGNCYEFGF